MSAKKTAKKKTEKTSAMPTNKAEFEKAKYTQVKSGRWVKDVAEYNRKVREGIIDPETGRRTGKKDPKAATAKKATAKKTVKAKAKKAKAKKAPAAAPAEATA